MKNKNMIGISPMTLVVATALIFMSAGTAMATVWTDQADYSPGSTVIISGNNSDGIGYLAGETVNVSVNGPYQYDSKCGTIADENGAWSCQITLSLDYTAEGSYTYTAVGQTSGVTQSGTFTDGTVIAAPINIFKTDCVTGQTSFIKGDTVCVKTTISVQGGGNGQFGIRWYNPSNILVQDTQFSGPDGATITNSFATTSTSPAGTWTVKTCKGGGCGNVMNTKTFTLSGDTTPPVITPSIGGTLGSNGWYTSDVTVSWTVNDPESTVTSTTDCGSATISTDTTGTTLKCSATSTGGTSSQSVTIKRDTTSPVITVSETNPITIEVGSAYTDAGATAVDNGGPVPVSVSGTVNTDVIGSYTITYTATDDAGHTTTTTRTVNVVDTIAPVVTISAPANDGYYNTGTLPTLTYTINDASTYSVSVNGWSESEGVHTATVTATDVAGNIGSASVTYIVDNTPPVVTINAPTAGYYQTATLPALGYTVTDNLDSSPNIVESGWSTSEGVHTVTITATDKAGNIGSDDVTYTIDNTKPEISKVVTGTTGDNGWYVSDVMIDWAVNDPESGITSSSGCDDVTITPDTTGITYTCTTSNGAGIENSDSVTIKVDKTKPDVTATPDRSADHNGWYNAPVTISFSGTDGTSGIESCDSAVVHNSDAADETISGNCKDNAGNIGTGSYTLKYDGTAPTIAGSRTPSANTYGWNNGDVTVHFECGDALSGVDSCNSDVIVVTEGSGQSATGTVTDVAGNTASAKVEGINIDKTVPTISGSPTTSPNGNGWYNSDVTVHFECGDGLSGVVDSFFDVFFPIEGEGQSVSRTCTDKAGNSVGSTVSDINIDKTPPTITGSRTPSPNTYGWNNGDVTVHFDGSDSLSGVYTITPDTVVSSEGAGQSVEGTVVDKAGNTASTTVSGINIDKTVPTIIPSAKTSDGSEYTSGIWTNKDVTVEFSCTDSGSGIDSCSSLVTKSGEGAEQSVSGTATDQAGNTATAAFSGINIDKTPPTIDGDPTTTPNSHGWYNTDVTIHFDCNDELSGVSYCSPDPTLSNEGAGQSVTGTVTDKAGNTASYIESGINIDKTAPTVTLTVPTNGNYILNQAVAANFNCGDSLSGVSTCVGKVVNGANIDTSSVGSKSFSVTGTDAAGNVKTTTVTYTVGYATLGTCVNDAGLQILQPVNKDGTSVFKQGSTVPAKFRACDANGVSIGTAGVVKTFMQTGTSADPNAVVDESIYSTTPDTAFRWSSTDQQWIFNMATKGSNFKSGTMYYYTITLNSGQTIKFNFALK